jgi:hypothetical protein
MSISSFIGDHTLWIGIIMVGSFCIWKFVLQPVMNEGKPIEPTEEDLKPIEEKLGLDKLTEDFNKEINF